ncbi:MAG: aldo/keto reductase [Planctomycetes bacterium SM23_65]|nr:MAG: aldo/keto reductase [Planctomycetes bacterium SM23_65]
MLYRRMESTGDELSILGFGCMRLPQRGGRIDEERARRQLRDAIDRGVNYVDTAFSYHMGTSEPFLGRALSSGYRDRVRLATKLPHWSTRTREDMDRILGAQLERLRTDHIDYYLLHALDGKSWVKMRDLGALEFLERAKADGRITHAGFSFHGDLPAFKEIVGAYGWQFCQIQYNILDERLQAGTEGLEYAAARGLGLIIMEPLRGGALARNVPPEVQAVWDEAAARRTPAEWALRWIWNLPEVHVVLSGMNAERHIDENIRIASEALPNSLTESELATVRRAGVPCPAGVAIPSCLQVLNGKYALRDRRARMHYAMFVGGVFGGRPAYASLCQDCGACIPKCPQHLPIPDLLRDVAREFEGPLLPWIVRILRRDLQLRRWWAKRGVKRAGHEG